MKPEQDPISQPTDPAELDPVKEGALRDSSKLDSYEAALDVYQAKVDQLQQQGLLRRPSQIVTEWELEDHWEELRRLYHQTCLELGLAWPPPFPSDGDID